MIDQYLCIVSQTDMIKFFNEIDENGNKDIFFFEFLLAPFLKQTDYSIFWTICVL